MHVKGEGTILRGWPARARPAVDILKPLNRGQHGRSADASWGVLDRVHIGRHLVNAIVPSMCGGNVTLCQITFTTCSDFVSDIPVFVLKRDVKLQPT